MKKVILSFFLLTSAFITQAQQAAAPSLYNPNDDAEKEIQAAIAKATKEKKHVLLQMGGNWCGWCLKFDKYVKDDHQIDSLVKANFVVYHVNYSNENKNQELLAKYEYPQRFGFPVFVILDAAGKRIHTQNSAYLEQGGSYDRKKVVEFFNGWSPNALKAERYKY